MKYRWRTKKKIFFFCSNSDFFFVELGKNILFGIGNGAEFPPQNRVIKSPEIHVQIMRLTCCLNSGFNLITLKISAEFFA